MCHQRWTARARTAKTRAASPAAGRSAGAGRTRPSPEPRSMPMLPEFDDPMARPRYTGLATFMRAPYREDLAGVDIGLIGVPFDGGVTNRTGTRHGPREVRNQSSLMRKINQASGIAPYELCTVADLGDAWVERPFQLEGSLAEIAGFFERLHAAGVVPLSAGGDHSISLPILRAIAV